MDIARSLGISIGITGGNYQSGLGSRAMDTIANKVGVKPNVVGGSIVTGVFIGLNITNQWMKIGSIQVLEELNADGSGVTLREKKVLGFALPVWTWDIIKE